MVCRNNVGRIWIELTFNSLFVFTFRFFLVLNAISTHEIILLLNVYLRQQMSIRTNRNIVFRFDAAAGTQIFGRKLDLNDGSRQEINGKSKKCVSNTENWNGHSSRHDRNRVRTQTLTHTHNSRCERINKNTFDFCLLASWPLDL